MDEIQRKPEYWVERLKDPSIRARLRAEPARAGAQQQNEFLGAQTILLVGFRNEALKPLTGKSLAEVAAMRGTSPEDTIMDLIVSSINASSFRAGTFR